MFTVIVRVKTKVMENRKVKSTVSVDGSRCTEPWPDMLQASP